MTTGSASLGALMQASSFNGHSPFSAAEEQEPDARLKVFRWPQTTQLKFCAYQAADRGKIRCLDQVDSANEASRIKSVVATNTLVGIFETTLMRPLRQCRFFDEMKAGTLNPGTIERVQAIFERVLTSSQKSQQFGSIPEDQRLDFWGRTVNTMLFCYDKEFNSLYRFVQEFMHLEKSRALTFLSGKQQGSIANSIACTAYTIAHAVQSH